MIIDAHAHCMPETVVEYIRKHEDSTQREITKIDGMEFLVCESLKMKQPIRPEYYNHDTRLRDMAKAKLDKMVLSLTPSLYCYQLKPEVCLDICRISNDWIAEQCEAHRTELGGMMTLPLQDVALSVKEAERAKALGLNAVEIEPMINGKTLDDPELYDFYDFCEKNDIVVYLHPTPILSMEGLPFRNYYNMNILGTGLETIIGIDCLIYGGIFEKYPNLKVLTSHGGGYFPYQLGRINHGYDVRPETRVNITHEPTFFLKNLYFDTITHWSESLEFLVKNFGADHVLAGTDYPYDMGDYDVADHVNGLPISDEDKEKILHGNAKALGLI